MNRRVEYRSLQPSVNLQLQSHIAATRRWERGVKAAHRAVKDFAASALGIDIQGFTSKDGLGLDITGVVLSDRSPAPTAGKLIQVPAALCPSFPDKSDLAFVPDVSTTDGRHLRSLLDEVSRQHGRRPLLANIQGVQALGLSDGRVIITRAQVDPSGVPVISAAATAVTPSQTIVPHRSHLESRTGTGAPAKPGLPQP